MARKTRSGFAARQAVIVHRIQEEAGKARLGLSALWHRDAAAIRKGVLKAERRAAEALHQRWLAAKPKAIEAGKRGAAAARKALHKGWVASKPAIIRVEEKVEHRLVALLRRLRPTV